jgi:hypothetical protein
VERISVADPDQSETRIRIRIKVKRLKLEPRGAIDVQNRDVEAQNNAEPWRVFRPMVAYSHHFDEEQDPDSHQSGKSDPDPIRMKVKRGIRIQTRIRIRLKVMQIRNTSEDQPIASLSLINRLTWSSYFLAKVPEAANS